MGKSRVQTKVFSLMAAGLAMLMALVDTESGQAASFLNSCTYCHGMSVRDGNRKGNPHFNSRSSSFAGNHASHLPAVPTIGSCNVCHTPVTTNDFGHQNNVIRMSNSLNGYSTVTVRATYDKGIFFNHTSIPNLTNARCSNVDCHFEKRTPLWGTSATATTCETCHGAVTTPLTFTHSAHIVALGNTIAACASCHSSYSGATAYAHATSAGRPIAVSIGGYTGSNNRYLPSQAAGRVTGTCSSVTCHGSATLMPWNGTLWSTTDQCGKCHSSTAAGAVTSGTPFYSTGFPAKVTATTDAKVGTHTGHMASLTLGLSANLACTDCHGTATLRGTTHMNGSTTFVWSALATRNGTLTPTYTPGTGQCANTYCHGASMPGGDISGTNRVPAWNSTTYRPAIFSAAACATCHGFPPPSVSGHPAATIPAGFPATAAIGTGCSCHPNVNSGGNSYATMFVNPSLHINGTLETPQGGHAMPYYNHQSSGTGASCTGCHAIGTTTSVYPAAAGTAPNCRGCHKKAAPGTGTGTAGSCGSCHGSLTATAATSGRPTGTAFPDKVGQHNRGVHNVACTRCHVLGTGAGTGATLNHGAGNRGTNPNVVGPGFVTGITITGATKGVSPRATCNHSSLGSGCTGGPSNASW